jgi:acyl-CoA thioester hydrolase
MSAVTVRVPHSPGEIEQIHRLLYDVFVREAQIGEAKLLTNMRFTSRHTIYWDQLDLMGILHNAAFPLLFERARTEFWRSLGYYGYGDPAFDWPYMVVRNEVNYRAPIERDEEIEVTVYVDSIGRTSLTFGHEVFRGDGALAADGRTVLVRTDPETRKPIPWTDSLREKLQAYLAVNEREGT